MQNKANSISKPENVKNLTCTILSHISFAVTRLPSDSPKHGRTVTLTFCVSQAATAKVTGGFPFAVLQHSAQSIRKIKQHNGN